MRMSRMFAGLLVLVAVLAAAASAYGLTLQEFPAVPHPVEGLEDCLACHGPDGDYPFPADHEGRGNEMCLVCHQVDVPESIPGVPHSIEGREDCLVCHATGGLKPFPADHEGRQSSSCLLCHQLGAAEEPTPVPEPTATLPPALEVLPTPIHEPVLFEENSCISCHGELGGIHEQITTDWSESVHAQQGVGCVSCHGGDPTEDEAEEAMSPEAGFLGPLPKDRIPGLCGSCHSDVELMRQFGLPTDQFDQYWQSRHGQALLEGDTNVATCYDCHGGHRILKTTDPASNVYPSNEPAMCAGCHADASLMATYDIPADQFELYKGSVHGVALLEEQNLRAPTCSVCHGKHGAAPPGFEQVANVCGQCHATTEDYYKQGAHRTGMTGEVAPRCVTCHGIHDVVPATRELFVGTAEGHCGSCHPPGSETNDKAQAMYEALTAADQSFAEAEDAIATATEARLIMAEQEELLHQAQTPLIESRALQHTVDQEQVEAKAEESLTLSQQAKKSAEDALAELDTRRLGMIVSLAVILVTILALVLIKRELDRDLQAKRARQRDSSSSAKQA